MSPAVLLSLGAFTPPTVAHLRAFERARDFAQLALNVRVVEGLVAPESGTLHGVQAKHRIRMVEAAVRSSSWLRSACWQCSHSSPQRPSTTILHYLSESHKKHGPDAVLFLLLGVDQLIAMGEPGGQWTPVELDMVLSRVGFLVVKRGVAPLGDVIYRNEMFRRHQKNIHLIEDDTFPNSLSSSKVRTAIERGESVRYCIDEAVLEYIQDLNLFDSIEQPQTPPTPPSPPRLSSLHWTTPPPSDSSTQAESNGGESARERPAMLLTGRQLFDMMDNAPRPSSDSPVIPTSLDLSLPDTNNLNNCFEMRKLSSNENCSAHIIMSPKKEKKKSMTSPKKEDRKKKPPLPSVPGPLSPDYDNVTLDELLMASTSWAEFMGKQARVMEKEDKNLPPAPPPPSLSELEKKRGWLCGKPKRQSDDSLIGICGTDRRKLGQLSPEIFRKWNKFQEGVSPSKQKGTHKTQSNRCVEEPSPPPPQAMTQSLNEGPSNGVTLTFRRYQLSSAPETTV